MAEQTDKRPADQAVYPQHHAAYPPRPCPHCGVVPASPFQEDDGYWYIACLNKQCSAMPSSAGLTEGQCLEDWDRHIAWVHSQAPAASSDSGDEERLMADQGKHTPLPWKWGHDLDVDEGWSQVLCSGRDVVVCHTASWRVTEEHKAFIETAVNSHAALLEACRSLLGAVGQLMQCECNCDPCPLQKECPIDAAEVTGQAAIALAEGESHE